MGRWIDVTPDKWYYNEMEDASNIYLEDGDPLIVSIPYNVFEQGKPYVYKEITALANQQEFELDVNIEPSNDNPLYIYVNGVQTVYKEIKNNGGKTTIILYQGVPEGTVVSFASYGKAKVNDFGRPSVQGSPKYPSYTLEKAANYTYNKNNSQFTEYVYAFGKQLRRARIPEDEINNMSGGLQKVLSKYIGYKDDTYYITDDGTIHMPYNLNNVTCKVVYTSNEGFMKRNTEEFKPTSDSVLFLNRAFPLAKMYRAEGFVLMNRLRSTFYSRFTDVKASTYNLNTEITAYKGQRLVSVGGSYVVGSGELSVTLNGVKQNIGSDYEEDTIYTVMFKDYLNEGDVVGFKVTRTQSPRLYDVGRVTSFTRRDTGTTTIVNGTVGNPNPEDDSWWAPHIMALEQEYLASGENMVDGVPVQADGDNVMVNSNLQAATGDSLWFMPNSFMTRAEAVTILNRFRKLCLEKLL